MAKGKHDPNLKAECLRLRLDERMSYKQIQEKLGVPKGTLSYWLGEHPLTHEELDRLRNTPPVPVRKSRGEESELYGWVKSANIGTIQTAKVSEAAVMLRMLANGFNVFTTTLASSRWKDRSQILDAGRSAAADWPGLVFWEHDWRKGGLTERKAELNREYGFYQQTYCGCVHSLRATGLRRVSDGSDS